MYCPKRILVGVDYGAQSVKATSTAIELAKALGASVHLLNAWTAPYAEIPIDALSLPRDVRDHNLLELVRQSSATSMQAFIAQFESARVELDWFVESGDPRRLLLHHAQNHDCDWIVVGTHGHTGLKAWVLGSVAAHIVRHSPVPVLVVPPEPTSPQSS